MRSLWLTRSYQGRGCRVAKRDCTPVHWAIQENGISIVKPRRPFGLTDPKAPPPTRGEVAGVDPEAGGAAAEAPLIEERTRLQNEAQEARAEADHAKSDQVRMARDVATMFDKLRALADKHAELHADRARLVAELEQAQRRWWHRWLRR
jgi:hypothetical protein